MIGVNFDRDQAAAFLNSLLADWDFGKDPDKDGVFTAPFAGRGELHDMDSDTCWGRVGQAMFFRELTQISIQNGIKPEINPGSSLQGASDQMTLPFWVHPLQPRTGIARLALHNYLVDLKTTGQISVYLQGSTGGVGFIESATLAAPDNTWTHVALTWRDSTPASMSEMRLFINGQETASNLSLPFDRLKDTPGDHLFGCLTDCVDNNDAVLLLDEVALKNSALSGDDILAVALQGTSPDAWDNASLPPMPPAPFDNDADGRVPLGSPYDHDMALIGADLFRDVQLSADKTMSCATCHNPERAFTEDRPVAIGWNGSVLRRNTSSIFNRRFGEAQFWEGRAQTLEDQALDPVFHPDEMGLASYAVLDNYLENDSDYNARFAAVGISDITEDAVRQALATYMRFPVAGNAPVDQFEAGSGGLSDSELRGRALFHGRARCVACHNGPNYTDERLWSTGSHKSDGSDDGASNADASPSTAGRARFVGGFKTPTLREIANTSPYFHDGHAASLHDVVAFYNAGGVRQDAAGHDLHDPGHGVVAEQVNAPLGLSSADVDDLVAFLEALSGTDIQDDMEGLDQVPVQTDFAINRVYQGPLVTDEVTVRVKDFDGPDDLDPLMDWTLELEVDGETYNWSDVSKTPITWGYLVTVTVAPTPSHSAKIRAADKHGRWSSWLNL